jgi:DNA-binding LacI/PurR family transcriptional regulator
MEVPRELCVMGFDDIEQAGWASYRLTTFAPPVELIAAKVAELASTRGGEQPGSRVTFDAPMVWRGTVRPGASRD